MKHRLTLTVTSLLAAILFSLHWADEVARGLEPGTRAGVGGLFILAVWLCALLMFGDRWWGLVIVLLASLLASAVPIMHMGGRGLVEGRYGTGAVMLFWVWTNFALGVSGMVSLVLTVGALWSWWRNRRGNSRKEVRSS